jgi:hypothetical protein
MVTIISKRLTTTDYVLILVSAVLIFGLCADYFVSGGVKILGERPLLNWRRTMTAATSFATVVATVLLVRRYFRWMTRREPRWWTAPLFFLSFIATLGLHFTLGRASFEYNWLFALGENVGSQAAYAIMPIALVAGIWRRLAARDAISIFAIVLFVLATMTETLWGQVIWTPLFEVGWWFFEFVSPAGITSFDTLKQLGILALIVRVLFGKEKLRSG